MTGTTGSGRKPIHPYIVLIVAILLPGVGHWLIGKPVRGLQFAFFIVLFGWLTSHVAPAEASLAGRYAGGVFVYALSLLDAYRGARLAYERWRIASRSTGES